DRRNSYQKQYDLHTSRASLANARGEAKRNSGRGMRVSRISSGLRPVNPLITFYSLRFTPSLHVPALQHLRGGPVAQRPAPDLLEPRQQVVHAQAPLLGAV